MTKAVHDMTAEERAELFKALTLKQKDASVMDSFNVVDAWKQLQKQLKSSLFPWLLNVHPIKRKRQKGK